MATVRKPLVNPVQIPISPSGTVPLGYENLQVPDNTPVDFMNGANFPVNVVFTNQFGTINDPIGQPTAPINAQTVTVNYTLYNANTNQPVGGPYSIQWGLGVMEITISGGYPTPPNITIAKQAQIQFINNDAASYPIQWTPKGSFSPEPASVSVGVNPAQRAVAQGQTVDYQLTVKPDITRGGTVKIGS